MQSPGPMLETLTHRLGEVPADFLAEPRIGAIGEVTVAAVVHDLLRMHGGRVSSDALQRFMGRDASRDRERLALVLIGCWLLADAWFLAAASAPDHLFAILANDMAELAASTPAHRFVHDSERREELVRVVLARLGFRPAGESLAQATDRLSAISGSERRRLLTASRAAEERARAIREALAKKAAEESADKWTRE